MKQKIISLLLALSMSIPLLAACDANELPDGSSTGDTDSQPITDSVTTEYIEETWPVDNNVYHVVPGIGWASATKDDAAGLNLGDMIYGHTFVPVDLSEMKYMEFDLWVADASKISSLSKATQFELTSSGKIDEEEYCWDGGSIFTGQKLVDGWNHLKIDLPKSWGGCDKTQVDYIRWYYVNPTVTVSAKIANLRFTNDESVEPGSNYNETPTLYVSSLDPSKKILAEANIKNFGAKGNGRFDDTPAFEYALTYLSMKGGGTVFVPAGTYRITKEIIIPSNVRICGEIAPNGSVKGATILMIDWGAKQKEGQAFKMNSKAAVSDLAIWYPDQKVTGTTAVTFPATFSYGDLAWVEGCSIENVTLVNSYIGMDFNGSMANTRNIRGTALKTGYRNNASYDISRVENIEFSASWWLDSGLDGTPKKEDLEKYLKTKATGFIFQRVDWIYATDLTVKGYNQGIVCSASDDGSSNGLIYNANITGGTTALNITASQCAGLAFHDSIFEATSTAVKNAASNTGDVTFTNCSIKSPDKNAVTSTSTAGLSFANCTIEGKFSAIKAKTTLINCKGDFGSSYKQVTDKNLTMPAANPNYNKENPCQPTSDKLIILSDAPYNAKKNSDISTILQKAIDDLKETGGTIYIPSGSYELSKPITVHSGVVVRGNIDHPHYAGGTTLQTSYGRANEKGALIVLSSNSGLRGITIIQSINTAKAGKNTPYLIQGNGKGVFLKNISIVGFNLVDLFTNRCDEHYIDSVWGSCVGTGFKVGSGSKDGLIRDSHFNLGQWSAYQGDADHVGYTKTHAEIFVLEDCENQILYNNFDYCSNVGLLLGKNCKNAFVLGIGFDHGNVCIKMTQNATANIVGPQLVVLSNSSMTYLASDSTFTGDVTISGGAMWGTANRTAEFSGKGKITLVTASVLNPGAHIVRASKGTTAVYGSIFRSGTSSHFSLTTGFDSFLASGNVYYSSMKISCPTADKKKLDGTDLT